MTSQSAGGGFSYRPALDGLRAVAVLAVFWYHLDWSWAPGGFLGVDAFFVLSGYLITSLLVVEHDSKGRIDLVAFWARRARRLLPALLLLLVVVSVWATIGVAPDRLDSLRADGLFTILYSANWHLIASGQSYFGLFVAPSPLRHTWSLAIEEQFYLGWPLIVAIAMYGGRRRRWAIAAVSAVGVVASVAVMGLLYDAADPSRAYYGTDSRAHSLLVGVLLALALDRWKPSGSGASVVQGLGILGAGGMAWAIASTDERGSGFYHGGSLLYAIAVAAVIAASTADGRSILRSALSVAPLRWVGTISYGVYLWHWPAQVVMTPARVGVDGVALDAVKIAATFGASVASYYLMEKPIRHGGMPNRRTLLLAPVAMVAVGAAVVGGTRGGVPLAKVFDVGAPITAPASPVVTAPGDAPVVAVIGDSVAGTVIWGLEEVGPRNGLTILSAAFPGCGVANGVAVDDDGRPFEWSEACDENIGPAQAQMIEEQDPDLVVWLSTWDLADRLVDGRVIRANTPEGDEVLLASMDVAHDRLTARGAHIALLTVPRTPGATPQRPTTTPTAT
ncbi:MAG: acyltransferase [Acidimicrobiia bacterium]|nr:acyltransferase [Acidimicrobiia bacterium]